MAKTILLDTDTVNFGSLFAGANLYRVPRFQRDYSWREEHWEDLWNDILVVRAKHDDRHYMGALVLKAETDHDFLIIDGQQRIATLSILALAVIARLKELSARGIDTDQNKERAELLSKSYVGDKDARSLTYSSKLFLNDTDNPFYKDYLLQFRQPRNPRTLAKSSKRLWDAFNYFSEKLSGLGEVAESGETLAGFLTQTIATQLMFIRITVEDQLNAYTVFETLNARGVDLSATDLLKNYILSLMPSEPDLDRAQRAWQSIIDRVQYQHFPELMRYYLNLQHEVVRKERLFKIVKTSVDTPVGAFKLLDALEEHAELFVALGDPGHEYWIESKETRGYIRELVLFRVRQVYPLLFAAYKIFDRQDFNRVLKLVVATSFRYNMIGGRNANVLERAYSQAAIGIVKGEINSPRNIYESLQRTGVYLSDDEFTNDFMFAKLSTEGVARKFTRYVLYRLENDLADSGRDYEEDAGTIEHILPENPGRAWDAEFTHDVHVANVDRIGNLTLLEDRINRDVANSAYDQKRARYAQSAYAQAREITAESWTADVIRLRQERMANRAAHIWRADFG